MSYSHRSKEPTSGRKHAYRQDEYGKTGQGSAVSFVETHSSRSRREPNKLDPLEIPRSEYSSKHDRRESNYEPRSSYLASRGSDPFSTQKSFDGSGVEQETSQPISIYKGSSENHRRVDTDKTGGGRASFHPDDNESSSKFRSDRHGPDPTSYGRLSPNSIHDFLPESEDEVLSHDFGVLTMDAINDKKDYIISASAPAPRGLWPGSSSIRSPKATGFYDEGPPQSLKKGPSNALPYVLYEDKGKTVEHDLGDTQSSQKGSGHMKGAPRRVERLDPSYQVRNLDYKRFFVTGKIFSMLWTDPYSESTNSENEQLNSQVTIAAYNELVHSKIRRLVVVQYKNRCCVCLPITTYEGAGSQKKGINLNEHNIPTENRGAYYPPNSYSTYPNAAIGSPAPYHGVLAGQEYSVNRPYHSNEQGQLPPQPQRFFSYPTDQYSAHGYNNHSQMAPMRTASSYAHEDRAVHNPNSHYSSDSLAPPIARTPQHDTTNRNTPYNYEQPYNRHLNRDSATGDGEVIELSTLDEAEAEAEAYRTRRMSVSSGKSHSSRREHGRDRNKKDKR